MIAGIDGSSLLFQPTGVGRSVRLLLDALASVSNSNRYKVFCNAFRTGGNPLPVAPDERFSVRSYRVPGKLLMSWWRRAPWPTMETFLGPLDVFHSPNFFYHRPGKCGVVSTIHDLGFLRDDSYGEAYGGEFFRKNLTRFLPLVHRLIVPSQATLEDLKEFFPEHAGKARIVPHGLLPSAFEPVDGRMLEAVRARHNLPEQYGLAIGTIEPRKNYPLLLHTIAALKNTLPPGWKLAIIGKMGWGTEEVRELWRTLDLQHQVTFLGYLPDEEVSVLLKGAQVLASTSTLEGFGLPVLEALAAGTPVLAPPLPPYREIAGENYDFIQSFAPSLFADALVRILQDQNTRTRLIGEGRARAQAFTLQAMGRKTLAVYEEAYQDSR